MITALLTTLIRSETTTGYLATRNEERKKEDSSMRRHYSARIKAVDVNY